MRLINRCHIDEDMRGMSTEASLYLGLYWNLLQIDIHLGNRTSCSPMLTDIRRYIHRIDLFIVHREYQ